MKRVTQVFKDLMTPDDQAQSWYGWATNQMSHAFLGALIAVFAGTYWVVSVLLVAVIKESFDLYRFFSINAIIDSLNDILFWISGAGVVGSPDYRYWFLAIFFILLSVGIYFRVKKN